MQERLLPEPTCLQITADELMKGRNVALANPTKEVGFAVVGNRVGTMASVQKLLHLVDGNASGNSFAENRATVRATNAEVSKQNISALHPVQKLGIGHSHPLSVSASVRHQFSTADIDTIQKRTGSESAHLLFSINENGGVQIQAVNGLGHPINIEVLMPDGTKVLIGPGQPKGALAKALKPFMTPPNSQDGSFSIGRNKQFVPGKAANDDSYALAA